MIRTLVVDDDFAVRKLFSLWLRPLGDCETVVNGEEAVKSFQSAMLEGRPYGLLLMDIVMPVMDGIEALRRIRLFEDGSGIMPGHGAKVIMVTGASSPRQIVRSFSEQCEAYLLKPIDRSSLYSAMDSLELPTPPMPPRNSPMLQASAAARI